MAPTQSSERVSPALDHPEILRFLFHPRPESPGRLPAGCDVLQIPVSGGVSIGARHYATSDPGDPCILFFHGNGEIAADYDDIAEVYRKGRMQLLVADYRGYGRSTGVPTITHMMEDALTLFHALGNRLRNLGHTGPVIVMGRSLGSASALEIASRHPDRVDGLVVESGFASLGGLMARLGVSTEVMRVFEAGDLLNTDRIRRYTGPTLIIHAEEDFIIPIQEGLDLYEAAASKEKSLIRVPDAGHNDLFLRGFDDYMKAVTRLASLTSRTTFPNR